ncbi:MAG TPA: LLM class F420-dependent oxidoreductase, partial [Mycobacteriales bacterium]|nr:LLM class F420-dependent oxidoreductase [Mycobacteriales bacterium]
MKVALVLPTDRVDLADEFVTADAIAQMASAAERAGFGAVSVTEHPIPAREWLESGGHHALDPFVALAFAAAGTSSLQLQTHLCVLPYRNPFVTAKAAASLDRLSGGRLLLGVGAGYLQDEFAALGVDFAQRNELTDDAIRTMRAAWTGEYVTLDGRGYRAEDNRALPRPAQPGGPPIWVGGNSRRAIRRAVELGDGWLPMANTAQTVARRRTAALETVDDLARAVESAREHAASIGRTTPLTVAAPLSGLRTETAATAEADRQVEMAEQLARAGATYLYLTLPHEL